MTVTIGLSAAAVVALGIWIAGAIFGAGGLMARVEKLEEWQTGVDQIIARGGLEQRIKQLEDWRDNNERMMHELSNTLRGIDIHLARVDERLEFLIKLRRTEMS